MAPSLQLSKTAKNHLNAGRVQITLASVRIVVSSIILLKDNGSNVGAVFAIAIVATLLFDSAFILRNRRILRNARVNRAHNHPIMLPAQIPVWVAAQYNAALASKYPSAQQTGITIPGTLTLSGDVYEFVPNKGGQRIGISNLRWNIPNDAKYIRAPLTKYQGVLHFLDTSVGKRAVEIYTRCFDQAWLSS